MSKDKNYNFVSGNATHVGQVRKANEDYFGSFDTQNGYLFVVCDGMGGHVGGAKASRIAVESIRDFISEKFFENPFEALSQAIIFANRSIITYTLSHPELKGMGSTCVALLIKDDTVYYAHVGDSRIYLLSGSGMIQLTRDHSFVQSLVDIGEISEEEAEQHPRKNEISNALGLPEMKPPTLASNPLYPVKGDMFLLCSDGLTGMVKKDVILSVLKSATDIQQMADKLVELANVAGGNDNITVQLVKFINSPLRKKNDQGKIINQKPGNSKKTLILSIAFILIITTLGLIFKDHLFKNDNGNHPQMAEVKEIKIQNTGDKIQAIDIDWEINKLLHPIDTINVLARYNLMGLDSFSVLIPENKFIRVLNDKASLVFDATFFTEGFKENYTYYILSKKDTLVNAVLTITILEKPHQKMEGPRRAENDNQKGKPNPLIPPKVETGKSDSSKNANANKMENAKDSSKEIPLTQIKPPHFGPTIVEAGAPGILIDIISSIAKHNNLNQQQINRLSIALTMPDSSLCTMENSILKCTFTDRNYGTIDIPYQLMMDGDSLIFSDVVVLNLRPRVEAVDDYGIFDTSGVYSFNVRKNDIIRRANPALLTYTILKSKENIDAVVLGDSLVKIEISGKKKDLPEQIEIEYKIQYDKMTPTIGKLTLSKMHK